jgi:hypothetical protein
VVAVNAAEHREQLEAACWRSQRLTATQVDAILAEADRYASATAVETLASVVDDRARARRVLAAEASAAEHRERLEQATAERTGRTA